MASTLRLAPISLLLLLALAGPANAQTPALQPPVTIDGPDTSIRALSGLSVSRDGTGGLVYLKSVGGVDHVFVSALAAGEFGAPVEVDAALGRASSQPVIAAGDGGLLLIAFINGGNLYVVSRAAASAPFSAPQDLCGGAINPSISLSIHSEGYLAFAVADGSGYDVRDLYYDDGLWQLESGALNVTPADDAGTGSGPPQVAAAGDGEAIVTWGENGHIYARRVWFNMTSEDVEQADVPSLDGFPEMTSSTPVVGVGDSSAYADVAFREEFTNGTETISRVLVNRLVDSAFEGVDEADGQSFATGPGATAPAIAVMQHGTGFVTSELQGPDQVWSTMVGQNGVPGAAGRIDSLQNASASYPVPAIAGDSAGLIAWQDEPATARTAEIRARFYGDSAFGPEMVVSNPALGPTNAAAGLFAAGDHGGDVAIAYMQGGGPATSIEVAQLASPPGSFRALHTPHYQATTEPVLSWSVPGELWGTLTYRVTIDGVAVATTSSTSFRPGAALSQGPHAFQVTAVNAYGAATSTTPAAFFIDTVPPAGAFRLRGAERSHALLRVLVQAGDPPPPGLSPADASGVAKVVVNWGDGSSQRIEHATATHRYLLAGRYLLRITITDHAGNRTVLTRRLRITKGK